MWVKDTTGGMAATQTTPLNVTDPATTGPYYVEIVSSREVKLVLFSSNVTSLGRQRFRCTSQESGLSASMMLAESNYILIAGVGVPTVCHNRVISYSSQIHSSCYTTLSNHLQ